MYALSVRDHMMIAHSFQGAIFGPAQKLHGATYIVDAEFRRAQLDADGLVVDIGRATEVLRLVLAEFNFKNLDEVAALTGKNTTTEFMARVIFDRLAAAVKGGELGPGAHGLDVIRVTLHESHVAWASYEAPLGPAAR